MNKHYRGLCWYKKGPNVLESRCKLQMRSLVCIEFTYSYQPEVIHSIVVNTPSRIGNSTNGLRMLRPRRLDGGSASCRYKIEFTTSADPLFADQRLVWIIPKSIRKSFIR